MCIIKKLLYLFLLYPLTGENNISSLLSIQNSTRNEITITVESQAHLDFVLSYPITLRAELLDLPI